MPCVLLDIKYIIFSFFFIKKQPQVIEAASSGEVHHFWFTPDFSKVGYPLRTEVPTQVSITRAFPFTSSVRVATHCVSSLGITPMHPESEDTNNKINPLFISFSRQYSHMRTLHYTPKMLRCQEQESHEKIAQMRLLRPF